jgi:hypothetical protein
MHVRADPFADFLDQQRPLLPSNQEFHLNSVEAAAHE